MKQYRHFDTECSVVRTELTASSTKLNLFRFKLASFFAMTLLLSSLRVPAPTLRGGTTKQSSCLVLLLLLSLCSFGTNLQAQFQLTKIIDKEAKSVYMDNLDQVYLLRSNNELLKYDVNGQLKQRYSNNRLGTLTTVDVTNPLRILLFYADFQQVVVLDNNLAELSNFSFSQKGNFQITAIAASNSQSFWVFDELSQQLIRYNPMMEEEFRSVSFLQLLDEMIKVKQIFTDDNHILLQISSQDVLELDRFGALVRKIHVENQSDLSFQAHKLSYLNKNQLISYDLMSKEKTSKALPNPINALSLAVGHKFIAVLSEKAVFLLPNN